jgi:hypothetical protein
VLTIFALNGLVAFSKGALAQAPGGINLRGSGVAGAAGVGFTDFQVQNPSTGMKFDRGTFVGATIERGFNFLQLYLTLSLNHMNATGSANYKYTNLSSSTTYQVNDVNFKAQMNDIGLGLKLKLIDGYWFKPYIEGGGLYGFHELEYTSKRTQMQAIGSDFKTKDSIMGSGYYSEAGVEVFFSDRFGVKLAGRHSKYETKPLETLANESIRFSTDVYFLSALIGF